MSGPELPTDLSSEEQAIAEATANVISLTRKLVAIRPR